MRSKGPDMAKNSNCLEGMKCPECDSLGPFIFVSECVATWHDEGILESVDFSYVDNKTGACEACDYHGLVRDFEISNQGG